MTNETTQKIFHELKNSITFINSALQLVESSHPEVTEFAYWNTSMQELASLKKMLIELSSARLCCHLNLQETTTESFLREIATSCTAVFNLSHSPIDVQITHPLPNIRIDPEHLKRAFLNLIKNSYEAINASGRILLTACQQDDFVCLSVVDNGCGIAPEQIARLFVPFETTKSNGTGLGLVITKQIVESHGGYITVDSCPQKGCTFSMYLPCFQ